MWLPERARSLDRRLVELERSDVLVQWPNSNLELSGLKYPLTVVPVPDAYYDIEVHLATQTIYHTSETSGPVGASLDA